MARDEKQRQPRSGGQRFLHLGPASRGLFDRRIFGTLWGGSSFIHYFCGTHRCRGSLAAAGGESEKTGGASAPAPFEVWDGERVRFLVLQPQYMCPHANRQEFSIERLNPCRRSPWVTEFDSLKIWLIAPVFHCAMMRPGFSKPGVAPGATFSMSGWSGLMRIQAAKWFGFISASGGTNSLQASTA